MFLARLLFCYLIFNSSILLGQNNFLFKGSLLYSDYALFEDRYFASGAGLSLDLGYQIKTKSISSFTYGFRYRVLEAAFVPNLSENYEDLAYEGLSYSQIGITVSHRLDINFENPKFFFEYDLSPLKTIAFQNSTSKNLELRSFNLLVDAGLGFDLFIKNNFSLVSKLFISTNIIRSYNQTTSEILNEAHKIKQLWIGVSFGVSV